MMLLLILALLMGTATSHPMSKGQVGSRVDAYNNPGVQAGAGQGFSNQNSDQFAAEGQEGAGNFGTGGYAYYVDRHAHTDDGHGAAPGYGMEVAEPVLSDMSGMDPVYTFRSRSSYNNGRVMFFRTSYSPAEQEDVPEVMPVYSQDFPANPNVHANDQVKGGH